MLPFGLQILSDFTWHVSVSCAFFLPLRCQVWRQLTAIWRESLSEGHWQTCQARQPLSHRNPWTQTKLPYIGTSTHSNHPYTELSHVMSVAPPLWSHDFNLFDFCEFVQFICDVWSVVVSFWGMFCLSKTTYITWQWNPFMTWSKLWTKIHFSFSSTVV